MLTQMRHKLGYDVRIILILSQQGLEFQTHDEAFCVGVYKREEIYIQEDSKIKEYIYLSLTL